MSFIERLHKLYDRLRGLVYGWRYGYEALTTDQLTGLGSRQSFEHRGRAQIERRARRHRQLIIVTFDVDRLKVANDFLGHAAGDFILRKLGRIINSELRRNTDFAYRMGGDEFTVFLGNTTEKWALSFAQRVQEQFSCARHSQRFLEEVKLIQLNSADSTGVSPELVLEQLGLSFGINAIEGSLENPHVFDAALREADRRLYEGKLARR